MESLAVSDGQAKVKDILRYSLLRINFSKIVHIIKTNCRMGNFVVLPQFLIASTTKNSL
jgi:hypothetical protein